METQPGGTTRTGLARIFISYQRQDRLRAQELEEASQDGPRLELYSFPYDQAPSNRGWWEICKELITAADAVVCLVGPATGKSPYVARELDEAVERGIPILLAGPGATDLAQERGDTSIRAVEDVSPDGIIDALRGLA